MDTSIDRKPENGCSLNGHGSSCAFLAAIAAFLAMAGVARAAATYTYENDDKTYVATVTSDTTTISSEALAVLDANEVTNFVKRGSSTLVVDGGSTTYTGDVFVENGGIRLAAENALGVGPGTIYVAPEKSLAFNGCTVAKKVYYDCGTTWQNKSGLYGQAGTSTFKEKVTFSDKNLQIYSQLNSRLVFEGGFDGKGYAYIREATGGTIVFTNVAASFAYPISQLSGTKSGSTYCVHLVFAVAGNSIKAVGNNNAQGNRLIEAKVSTTVDWAFDDTGQGMNFGEGSLWDLCGTSQRVGHLDINRLNRSSVEGPMSIITNSSPQNAAKLYVTQSKDASPQVVFAGNLSVDFSGNKTTTIDHAMTAAGDITVNAGTLAFTADGSWPNAVKLTIASGANVSITSGATFGDMTEISIIGSGGFSIAAGEGGSVVTQTVGFLTVGGSAQERGCYAMGDGVLKVLYSGRREIVDSTLTLAAGESFTLSESIQCDSFDKIVLGAGASLDIETDNSFVDGAAFTLTLGEGASLSLADGIDLYATSVTVGGVAVAPGRHTAADSAWLAGAGEVFVPYGAIVGTDVEWTAEGPNTLMTTPLNWSADIDLTNGTSRALFAYGSEATVVGSTFLNGIYFNSSGAFSVVPDDASATLHLASGGISSTGSGARTISAPVCVDGDQTWQIDTALKITGAFAADPLSRYTIHKTGSAEVTLSGGDNFPGEMIIDNGSIVISGSSGAATGDGLIVLSNGTLALSETNIRKDILTGSNGTWNGSPTRNFSLWAGRSVISGKVALGNRNTFVDAWQDSHTTFEGGIVDASESSHGFLYVRPSQGGTIVITNKPMVIANALYINRYSLFDAYGYSGYIEFAVAGNRMPSLGYDAITRDDYRLHNCVLRTTVDWAFDNASQAMLLGHDSVWDLCGTSQRVGFLNTREYQDANPTKITNSSDSPATLYVNQTMNSTPWLDFDGKLSVDFSGNYTTTISREMTASGDLTVNAGTLAFTADGSWRSVGNVAVNGSAKLTVAAARTFNGNMNLTLASSSSLEIAQGVRMRVATLTVGGILYTNGKFSFGDGEVVVGRAGMTMSVR
ncbi:MAG: hypothetical protein IKO72_00710 [Kiritimatiellae bacterium]|nr:hypothetical protein [Kiritimatiellia bacterium]